MLMEQDPNVAVIVRKLVLVSLMEIFKDITPSYKIRPLTEAEKATKVKLQVFLCSLMKPSLTLFLMLKQMLNFSLFFEQM